MTPQQALSHYQKNKTFYFDDKGFKKLYKMLKKLVQQSKYATAEACCLCKRKEYLGSEYTEAKFCPTCHVWRLVQMIRREDERDGRKTTASD